MGPRVRSPLRLHRVHVERHEGQPRQGGTSCQGRRCHRPLQKEPFLLATPRPLQRQVWELCEKLGHLQQRLHLRRQAEKRTAQLEDIPTCCVIIYVVKGSGCRKIWGVEIKLQMTDNNLFTKESYVGLFIIGSLGFYN